MSCDATFASPLGQSSTALGIDLIMHSATKYIGGHGDAVGGAVGGRKDLFKKMRNESAIHHGAIMSPFNAWLIARGMATLPLRMKAHQAGAQAVAQKMIARLKIIHYAMSLGHHRSLIFWMATDGLMETSFKPHRAQLEAYRAYAGDGAFRLPIGLEDADDLIDDLAQVLG